MCLSIFCDYSNYSLYLKYIISKSFRSSFGLCVKRDKNKGVTCFFLLC